MIKLKVLAPRLRYLRTERVPILAATPTINPQATTRVRGRKGMRIRQRWLHEHPLCVACMRDGITRAADELDHVIPLSEGGKDDDSNRQSLCSVHHKAKSAIEANRRAGQISGPA